MSNVWNPMYFHVFPQELYGLVYGGTTIIARDYEISINLKQYSSFFLTKYLMCEQMHRYIEDNDEFFQISESLSASASCDTTNVKIRTSFFI